MTRRDLLFRSYLGLGGLALMDLLVADSARASNEPVNPMAPKPPHFPVKAKAVISIFCYGGVSQVDTFDPKPLLLARQGETMTGVGEVRMVNMARGEEEIAPAPQARFMTLKAEARRAPYDSPTHKFVPGVAKP